MDIAFFRIGSLQENDIVIDSHYVSRYHADMALNTDGSFRLTDHSTNGTLVNGVKINNTSIIVNRGDNILFAGVEALDWSMLPLLTRQTVRKGAVKVPQQDFNSQPYESFDRFSSAKIEDMCSGNQRADANPYTYQKIDTNPYPNCEEKTYINNEKPKRNNQSKYADSKMGFSDAIRICMKEKYASFEGRATRSEYWYFVLFYAIIMFAAAIVGGVLGTLFSGGNEDVAIGLALVLYGLAILGFVCPGISVLVRRFHDTGRSGWYYWLCLIPWIGGIIIFVFCCLDSQKSDNQYGAYPKNDFD